MVRNLIRLLSLGASAAGLFAYARFRREMVAIRAAVEGGSKILATGAGDIEYAEAGAGAPILVIHGAGGGYDQGLLIGSDIGDDYRVIAPSRFGYLRTDERKDFSPAAQADAHAALLDSLKVPKVVVVGASAGAPSAIELALRHPERVSALILLAPRTYHPTQSIGADKSVPSQTVLRLIEGSADFLFWLAMQVSRASVVRFFGVPPKVEASAPEPERARMTKLMRSMLPLSRRVRGIDLDGRTEMKPWPLERVTAPALIISAEDDLYNTLPGARFTAQNLRNAQLHILPTGGHLMVGRTAEVRQVVREFLRAQAKRRKPSPNHRHLEAAA